jgi:hypothetical protein
MDETAVAKVVAKHIADTYLPHIPKHIVERIGSNIPQYSEYWTDLLQEIQESLTSAYEDSKEEE